ncbi:hypothetical protein [Amycolatopsis sp. cmx-4-68]|uniref:hypothetical protein n=1 Tax=Amycolatopsis sp. cmx-4-68 TaxID=2790938 RepID=UPI00397D7173
MTVSKEDLLAKRFGVEDFEVPELGTFRIRALTRAQALEIKDREMPVAIAEQRILSRAVVEPQLSEEDVAELQAHVPAGLLEPLVDRIATISGMTKGSPKSGVSGA